jgi:hypothetical protein
MDFVGSLNAASIFAGPGAGYSIGQTVGAPVCARRVRVSRDARAGEAARGGRNP